jgi:hypothetical protein
LQEGIDKFFEAAQAAKAAVEEATPLPLEYALTCCVSLLICYSAARTDATGTHQLSSTSNLHIPISYLTSPRAVVFSFSVVCLQEGIDKFFEAAQAAKAALEEATPLLEEATALTKEITPLLQVRACACFAFIL